LRNFCKNYAIAAIASGDFWDLVYVLKKMMTWYFDLSNVVLTTITQNHDNFSSHVVMVEQLSCTLNQNILSCLNKLKKLRSDKDRSLTGKPILFKFFPHF